jgi:hypothetical protein
VRRLIVLRSRTIVGKPERRTQIAGRGVESRGITERLTTIRPFDALDAFGYDEDIKEMMQMSSPFPGMEPYIEAPDIWSDFHGDLAAEMRAELNRVLQPRYVARLTLHATYEIVEIAERHNIRPDLGVWQPQPPSGAVTSGVAVITARPVESVVAIKLPLRWYTDGEPCGQKS